MVKELTAQDVGIYIAIYIILTMIYVLFFKLDAYAVIVPLIYFGTIYILNQFG